jgi:uncharacterized protein YfaS (alpha-2-macroglobulin family)
VVISHRWLKHLLLGSLLFGLVGCNFPGVKPASDQTPTFIKPTAQPQPPVVADRYPSSGEILPLNGAIDLYFDQPMDPDSVNQAFSISPSLAGSLEWINPSQVRFVPGQPFKLGSDYAVTVGTAAKASNGMQLASEYRFTAQTVGTLQVVQALPVADAVEVASDSVITVVFNRPVVALQVGGTVSEPNPLVLDPPVVGKGEWLNTSIFTFRPDKGFAGGTAYTATVKAGLTDTAGTALPDDYRWQFSTSVPQVVETTPYGDTSRVRLTTSLTVRFNQPMDRASTEASLKLVPSGGGAAVVGKFNWADDNTQFVFEPDAKLLLDTNYRYTLDGALAANQQTPLQGFTAVDFTTDPAPQVLGSDPVDGEQRADPDGEINLTFASPMDIESFKDHVIITPKPENDPSFYFSDYNNTLYINFGLLPSIDYSVTVGGDVRDIYGNRLGQLYTFNFRTAPYAPSVYLNTQGETNLFSVYTPTRLFATHRNLDAINFKLGQADLKDYFHYFSDDYDFRNSYSPASWMRQWTESLTNELNEEFLHEVFLAENKGALTPGLYYLEMPDPVYENVSRQFLAVTDVNLTLKASFEQALVWVTDLQTGKPVMNREVVLYNAKGTELGRANSDSRGLVEFTIPADTRQDQWEMLYALADARTANPAGFGMISTGWNAGIYPGEFGLYYQSYRDPLEWYLYSDRPLYRPGQEVQFKGVLRNEKDARFSLPDFATVPVQITNPEGEKVFEQVLSVSEYGTVNGTFKLADAASVGYYQILLGDSEKGPNVGLGFQVAEYVKPEFVVSVQSDKSEYVQGDTINATIDAQFYFGGALTNANVEWNLLSADYYFDWQGDEWYSFSDSRDFYGFGYDPSYGAYGEVIASGQGVTDANGKLQVSLPAEIKAKRIGSQRLTLEATVTDLNDRVVSGRTELTVHQGLFYIGVRPLAYVVAAGESAQAEVITVDWQGNPVPNQALKVEVLSQEWLNVQEEDEYGNKVWTWDVKETSIFRGEVATGSNGKALFAYTLPKGGNYKIRVTGLDSGGHTVASSISQWCTDTTFVSWRQDNNNRIALVADKRSYKPGDTAEILIPSPFQKPAKALVTVERGTISHTEVIDLPTNSTLYRLPITAEYAPNVYVSVVLIQGVDETNPTPAFRMGLLKLPVSAAQQKLLVTVTADTATAQPGQAVTYTVFATDAQGKPVQAEFSLALADLAVLALTGPNSASIFDTFYSERPLSVQTALGLSLSIDTLNEVADKAKGGGGGALAEAAFVEVRGDFRDTAYWNAQVVTGVDGLAKVTVTLPDNLTTWRLDARGTTKETLVGDVSNDLVSTKSLLIRPSTPRFFVVGDKAELVAIVNNNTDQPITGAKVSLSATGLTLQDAAEKTVDIPAKGQTRVAWQVIALPETGADLVFQVQAGELSDASRPPLGIAPTQTLPIYRYVAPETVGTAGVITGENEAEVEVIALPRRYDASQGQLTIKTNASLVANLQESLDVLDKDYYEYDSTDFLISRFLPNLATYQVLSQLNRADVAQKAALEKSINQAIQTLGSAQHPDGGWGWWSREETNPYVTAYVVFGIAQAQQAGFTINADVLQRAVDYLKTQLESPTLKQSTWHKNRQVFILYALATAGKPDASQNAQYFTARDQLDTYAQALLALTLAAGDPQDTRVKTLLSDLNSTAVVSATGTHWQERNAPDYYNMNTDLRTTALSLLAFARLQPDNPQNPNIVRWLMVARNIKGIWRSPQETVWSLLALSEWLRATGELKANYAYQVLVNGQRVQSVNVTDANVTEQQRTDIAIAELFSEQANRVSFEHGSGSGSLYYTAHLNVYQDVPDLPALSKGLSVARQYTQISPDCGGTTADGERQPDCPVIQSGKIGDQVRVLVTLIVPSDAHYVVLEDPIPAGAEVVDTSLLTTSVIGEAPQLSPRDPFYYGWGWWWWSNTQIRANKVQLSASYLPAGTYQYTYTIRLGLAGEYSVIPTTAFEQYFPEVFARAEGTRFTILPK